MVAGWVKRSPSHLAQLGATIYICGRRESVLQETATEINNEHSGLVIPVGLDIRSSTDVQARIDEIFSAGPLDGLVNNAAGNFVSPTHKLSARGFEAISNIVFRGSFYITHAVGCKWIEQGLPGSVVSILTTWVWTGSPFVVPSAMSKAGINVMTKSLAVEWGGFGIRLNAIAPGPFPTEGAWERLNIDGGSSTIAEERQEESERKIGPLSRVGQMQELKNLTSFLLSDGCDYLTGQTIALDGAQHLASSGFAHMAALSDDQWDEVRTGIKAADERERSKRTA